VTDIRDPTDRAPSKLSWAQEKSLAELKRGDNYFSGGRAGKGKGVVPSAALLRSPSRASSRSGYSSNKVKLKVSWRRSEEICIHFEIRLRNFTLLSPFSRKSPRPSVPSLLHFESKDPSSTSSYGHGEN